MFAALKENLADPKKKVQWYDLVGRKEAKRLIDQSLADGRRLLEKLNSVGVPVYVVPGNNDWPGFETDWAYEGKDHYSKLIKGLKNIVDLNHKMTDTGEHTIIGYGESSGPEYPQYEEDVRRLTKAKLAKKKTAYTRLKKEYDALFTKAKKEGRGIILLSHNVPFDTKIDYIDNPASPRNSQHFGSILVRYLVERHEPLVALGAHMHEHFGAVKLGRTYCVNAGYGKGCNVLLDIKGRNVERLKFIGKAHEY
jgi:Icc-related predicted phosphoesterase